MSEQISKTSLSALKTEKLKNKAAELKVDIAGLRTKGEIISAILVSQNILEPNLVFTGKRKVMGTGGKFESVEKDVPKAVGVPSGKIVLPDGVKYGEPFYHEDANVLIANSKDFESPSGNGN